MAGKKLSRDILTSKEIADLLCQHIAIRSQIRFLINGLNDLSIESNQEIAPTPTLNEQIRLYRYLLNDFQEAIRRHNALYQRIEMLNGVTSSEEIIIEKKEIEQQLDNIIWLAYEAVYNGLQLEELNRCASDIIEAVNRICESIDEHMVKEEKALK